MSLNVTANPLAGKQERAARLVAEDELTDEKIAAEVGISQRQLERWKKEPIFSARVSEHIAQITEQVLSSGYCRVDKRLRLLNQNVERIEAIIAAKAEQHREVQEALRPAAADPADGGKHGEPLDDEEEREDHSYRKLVEMADMAGAEQGLHFRKETPTRFGTVTEFSIGTHLIATEQALLKQIAQETGQWVERIAGSFNPAALSEEELRAIAGRLGQE